MKDVDKLTACEYLTNPMVVWVLVLCALLLVDSCLAAAQAQDCTTKCRTDSGGNVICKTSCR